MRDPPSSIEQEKEKIRLYNEFYQENKVLFNSNCQEFMFKQKRYVENKMEDWTYKDRKKNEN